MIAAEGFDIHYPDKVILAKFTYYQFNSNKLLIDSYYLHISECKGSFCL